MLGTALRPIDLLAPPQLFMLSWIFEAGQVEAVPNADLRAWWALAFSVVFSTFVAYGLWYYLMSRYPVSQVSPFAMLAPVIGAVAGVVTFAGVVLVQFKGKVS